MSRQTIELLAYLLLLAVLVITVIVVHGRLLEKRLRVPLSEKLDWLIEMLKEPQGMPIESIHTTRVGQRFEVNEPHDTTTIYEVYPAKSHYFMFIRLGIGASARYRAQRWHDDVLASPFPMLRAGTRGPAWFVDRMKTICDLVDAYPRERTRSEVTRKLLESEERISDYE